MVNWIFLLLVGVSSQCIHNHQNYMQSDSCSSSQKCLQSLLTTVGFRLSSLLAVLVFCYVWLTVFIPLNHYHHPPLTGMQTVFLTLISTLRKTNLGTYALAPYPGICKQQSHCHWSGGHWAGVGFQCVQYLLVWEEGKKLNNSDTTFTKICPLQGANVLINAW